MDTTGFRRSRNVQDMRPAIRAQLLPATLDSRWGDWTEVDGWSYPSERAPLPFGMEIETPAMAPTRTNPLSRALGIHQITASAEEDYKDYNKRMMLMLANLVRGGEGQIDADLLDRLIRGR